MRDAARGKFGISHLIVIDSFNFVYELVGATNTYLSMYETPERVREAIEFAYHLNLKNPQHLLRQRGDVGGRDV